MQFSARYEEIVDRVKDASRRSSRSHDEVEIMAVTKTQPAECVEEAYAAGIRLFGENRVGDAVNKYRVRPPGARLHMIGHLQRNKASAAAGVFDQIESIDKIGTVDSLLRSQESDSRLSILIEVNTSQDASKFGVRDDESLRRLIQEISQRNNVAIFGLMTIAPLTESEVLVRGAFAALREKMPILQNEFGHTEARTLSMGMSADFAWAIEEGSTRIRLGTILFGDRIAA